MKVPFKDMPTHAKVCDGVKRRCKECRQEVKRKYWPEWEAHKCLEYALKKVQK
jgi:hypothetical protein